MMEQSTESPLSTPLDTGCNESMNGSSRNDITTQSKYGEKRSKWNHQLDFIMTLIGYTVGLGNICRFPYLCMRNGGGAFLIPYFFFLFVCGLPLFYLECTIGQFSGSSAITMWNISPLFRGAGIGTVVAAGIFITYNNVIITWTLYYLAMSFTTHLPWIGCNHSWNTPQCFDPKSSLNETAANATYQLTSNTSLNLRTSPEEFWQFNVLQLSSGIADVGGIRWQLALGLLASWFLVFVCICKGIKSSGKIVYITATVPYIFLTALLIRGAMLPGSANGIMYFVKPDINKLLSLKTWAEASIQIFYTLGPGWGNIITMASYNNFNNNCKRDSLLVCVICCGTSFYGGFAVFAALGSLAHELGVPVQDVVTSGPGLAFIAYPAALAKIPASPIWSVCFFLMLLTVGLDTQFVTAEAFICACLDPFPKYATKHRTRVTAITCIVCFLISLIYVTRAGMYIFQIVDWYIAPFSLVIICLLECVVIMWIYGWERLCSDMNMMFGHRPGFLWKALWGFITPGILIGVLLYNAITFTAPSFGSYTYPGWAIGLGFLVSFLSAIPIPVYMIYSVANTNGTLKKRIHHLLRPSESWGPSDVSNLNGLEAKNSHVDEEEMLSLGEAD